MSAPARLGVVLRAAPPERLIIAPQDIRTSDPTIAADIGAGYFAFGGKIVNAHGRSPFAIDIGADGGEGHAPDGRPGDSRWIRQLAGFGWLRHLRAADSAMARQRGRVLVSDFLSVHGRPSQHPAWAPAVAARRMLAWLSQSPVILEGADRAFYVRFMQALETHHVFLDRLIAGGLRGNDRLLAALALAEFALCVQGGKALQKRGSAALASEIDIQILPDGGHVSRNPQSLIDLLLDLLPLRQAYAARGIQAPPQVLNAIDRMMPMLRLLRHADGTLALFNGMGLTAPELVATILAYDDVRAQPATNARHAGYQRLEAGAALVIVDAGASPPPDFSTLAHAGCLSFELSTAGNRIVVNCGAPDGNRAGALDAARSTAAHSTLVIDETSSCRFASGSGLKRWLGDQILEGPSAPTVERIEADAATLLDMSHDGYVRQFGLMHHRTLSLSDDGYRLDGTDRLAETGKRPAPTVPYVLRFHLHPRIRTRVTEQGALRLDASGEAWLFEADAPSRAEPSILFAATGGPRPTTQITIAANTATRAQISWSFRRIA